MKWIRALFPPDMGSKQQSADREEQIKTLLLFFYLFCVVSASTIGRTTADTLFLSRFDSSQLSFMYLPQAAALIFMGFVYQRLTARFRIDHLLPLIIFLVSGLSLVSRFLVSQGYDWIFKVIYVGYDVLNYLMIVCFWQLATAVLDQRKAKQTIVLVGSGGIIGSIVSGFGMKPLVMQIGTENLIYLYTGIQFLCLLLVVLLLRRTLERAEVFGVENKAQVKPSANTRRKSAKKEKLFSHVPHLKYIAIMSATLVISLTLIDYQFKVILRSTLQGEALASFMGSFYGFSGILSLIVQFFFTSKIIARFGVISALVVFPVVLFGGTLLVGLMPVLMFAVAVKTSDKALGDTIYASVNQLIMFPIPPEWRSRAKGFMDGVVRNGAKGIAAVAIIVLSRWLDVQQLSIVILLLLSGCIFAAIKVKGPYMQTLLSTLRTRDPDSEEFSLDLMDPASRNVLTAALHSADKLQAIYALRMLKGVREFDFFAQVPRLLEHPVEEVRVETMRYIQEERPTGGDTLLFPFIHASEPRVKAVALLALAAYAREDQLDFITTFLEVPETDVKASAIAGLIKYYGIEGMFRAVGKLKELMESSREEERMAMASLFGMVGITSFYKPLIPLLQDSSAQVRNQALGSAGILQVPELIPHIIPRLKKGVTREQALVALAAYDEKEILFQLEPWLLREDSSPHLPEVYERIGSQRAYEKLLKLYDRLNVTMRERILETLLRMKDNIRQLNEPLVQAYIQNEINWYWQLAGHTSGIPSMKEYGHMAEACGQMKKQSLNRIFNLLALIYDSRTILAVYGNWQGQDVRRQANATEVMDQLLKGPLRTAVGKLMSTGQAGAPVQDASITFASHLEWFYYQGDEWMKQVLQHVVHEKSANGTHPKKVTISLPPATTHMDKAKLSKQMEQVRLLKNAPLFRDLQGKDLATIALQLQEIAVPTGAEIIREEEMGDSLFIIQKGRAGVFRNKIRIGELGAGECFGEMAVLTHSLRTATVLAEEDMVLWSLDSATFYELAFDRTSIALEIIRLLSNRLRQMNDRFVHPKSTESLARISPASLPAPGHNSHLLNHEINNQVILRRVLVLQKISLFKHFSQDDFVRLAHRADEVEYEPGEVIFRTGDSGNSMYGIIEGRVEVQREGERLAQLHEGECFGEMALIDGEPRSADCLATDHSLLLELTRDQVFHFCIQRIDVLKSMMGVLAERLKDMQEKV